ncbi:hypothetical protein Tco_0915748 [Tanacetum coccineum]
MIRSLTAELEMDERKLNVSVKDLNLEAAFEERQDEFLIAIHEMLAEYGIWCASGDGEEGSFLKLAIKYLLYLDIELKSTFIDTRSDEQLPREDYA